MIAIVITIANTAIITPQLFANIIANAFTCVIVTVYVITVIVGVTTAFTKASYQVLGGAALASFIVN